MEKSFLPKQKNRIKMEISQMEGVIWDADFTIKENYYKDVKTAKMIL